MNFFKLVFVLFAVFALTSCSSDDDSSDAVQAPLVIDGFLSGKVDSDGQMALVGSKKELKRILSDWYDAYADKVDFTNNNLLLIHDVSNYGVAKIVENLTKTNDGYVFNVTVEQNMLCVMEPWCIAYVVPKTLKKDNLQCEITYVN